MSLIFSVQDPFKTFALLEKHIAALRSQHYRLAISECRVIIERNLGYSLQCFCYIPSHTHTHMVNSQKPTQDNAGV